MITVAKYRTQLESELGKIRLKKYGIEAFIADQAICTAGYGNVTGEIRLQVEESDVERASAILSGAEPVGLPDDFDPGMGSEHGTEKPNEGPAFDRIISEKLRSLSRTVQNCAIAVGVSLFLTCVYITLTFGENNRVYKENDQPSWGQVGTYAQRGEYDKAIRQAQVLIAKNPKDFYGHAYLTSIYMSVRDLTNAEKEARWTYELFPTEDHRQHFLAIERLQQQAAKNTSQNSP